jgi:hypothetical protein
MKLQQLETEGMRVTLAAVQRLRQGLPSLQSLAEVVRIPIARPKP